MRKSTYDIIVCGGGAGGLSFLSKWILSSLDNLRVLLIEEKFKNTHDRTWCYWSKTPLPYPESHVKSWNKFRISDGKRAIVKNSSTVRYFEINSLSFYQEVHGKLNSHPTFEQCLATVTAIRPGIRHCEVETTAGIFSTNHVINSIPDLVQPTPGRLLLTQNFKGIRLKTQKPVFDPDLV